MLTGRRTEVAWDAVACHLSRAVINMEGRLSPNGKSLRTSFLALFSTYLCSCLCTKKLLSYSGIWSLGLRRELRNERTLCGVGLAERWQWVVGRMRAQPWKGKFSHPLEIWEGGGGQREAPQDVETQTFLYCVTVAARRGGNRSALFRVATARPREQNFPFSIGATPATYSVSPASRARTCVQTGVRHWSSFVVDVPLYEPDDELGQSSAGQSERARNERPSHGVLSTLLRIFFVFCFYFVECEDNSTMNIFLGGGGGGVFSRVKGGRGSR